MVGIIGKRSIKGMSSRVSKERNIINFGIGLNLFFFGVKLLFNFKLIMRLIII